MFVFDLYVASALTALLVLLVLLQPVAIKILNPVGYKLFPSALLARCLVAVRGAPVAPPALDSDSVTLSSTSASSFRRPLSSPSSRVRLRPEYVPSLGGDLYLRVGWWEDN